MNLNVKIELNGIFVYVGKISGTNHEDACFVYDKNFLQSKNRNAISISLPLQKEKFSPAETRAFFSGLLPEGFLLESITQNMHFNKDDYLSVLTLLGNECLGAIVVLQDKESLALPSYQKLSEDQVAKLASEGATQSISLVQKAHLSLAGASGKVGLYLSNDGAHHQWYLPKNTAPSTHIVKQSHVRLKNIVINEYLCTQTAKYLGIDVPQTFIVENKRTFDDEILFATKRYDRIFDESSRKIDSLTRPYRLHQEDFAMALGISSDNKYEPQNKNYFLKMHKLIAQHFTNPLQDLKKLWEILIFNYLIGNTDAHIKNFSLLYNKNLSAIKLAPAYDLLSTVVYEDMSRNMAFNIGGQIKLDSIGLQQFLDEASKTNINPVLIEKWIKNMLESFEHDLNLATQKLVNQGFSQANKIRDKILQKGGYVILSKNI